MKRSDNAHGNRLISHRFGCVGKCLFSCFQQIKAGTIVVDVVLRIVISAAQKSIRHCFAIDRCNGYLAMIRTKRTYLRLDGYVFFKTVSNNSFWNNIPFIFLTNRSSKEDIRYGKSLGVDDYITKPYEFAYILAIISGKISSYKNIENSASGVQLLCIYSAA